MAEARAAAIAERERGEQAQKVTQPFEFVAKANGERAFGKSDMRKAVKAQNGSTLAPFLR